MYDGDDVRHLVERMKNNINIHVSRSLCDADLLAIGIASSCNLASDIIEYKFEQNTASELKRVKSELVQLSTDDFKVFLTKNVISNGNKLEECGIIHKNSNFKKFVDTFNTNMTCTLEEQDQNIAWKSPVTRLLVYVALHMSSETEERVNLVLGGVARVDVRRLEDMRANYEELGTAELFTLCSAIDALTKCVFL